MAALLRKNKARNFSLPNTRPNSLIAKKGTNAEIMTRALASISYPVRTNKIMDPPGQAFVSHQSACHVFEDLECNHPNGEYIGAFHCVSPFRPIIVLS